VDSQIPKPIVLGRWPGAFEIEAVETTYGISGKQQKAGEVLIFP
jgi:hypothetical protein